MLLNSPSTCFLNSSRMGTPMLHWAASTNSSLSWLQEICKLSLVLVVLPFLLLNSEIHFFTCLDFPVWACPAAPQPFFFSSGTPSQWRAWKHGQHGPTLTNFSLGAKDSLDPFLDPLCQIKSIQAPTWCTKCVGWTHTSQLLSGDVHSSRHPTLVSLAKGTGCPSALALLCTWAGFLWHRTGCRKGSAQPLPPLQYCRSLELLAGPHLHLSTGCPRTAHTTNYSGDLWCSKSFWSP